MNFHHLSYFKTAYESQNITRAARHLHVSQPAVSTAIKELEEELGVQLFVRQNRGLEATEAGNLFYTQACKMLAQFHNAKRLVREAAEKKGVVRLGFTPMAGHVAFPKIYEAISREHAEVELEILEGGSEELLKCLEEDRVEMVIVPEGAAYEEYERQEICRTRLLFAVSRDHPLAKKEKIDIHQLADVPVAIFRKGYMTNQNVAHLFESNKVPMKVIAQVSHFMCMKTLVECRAAGGFLMREICDQDENIKSFEIPGLPEQSVFLVWKKEGYLSWGARQMIRCCRHMPG